MELGCNLFLFICMYQILVYFLKNSKLQETYKQVFMRFSCYTQKFHSVNESLPGLTTSGIKSAEDTAMITTSIRLKSQTCFKVYKQKKTVIFQ